MSEYILELKQVSKIYPSVKALWKIDLTVEEGEWLAIMGPSGSGKTTLMNLISCMNSPSEGEIFLDGEDVALKTEKELTQIRRDKIGLVFQQFHLVPTLTALENVMLAQYYHSVPDAEEAREALAEVGLAERADHLPRQLSGGEQQRVCIARALINHPRLILADEPTGNLDEKNEYLVLEILDRLHKRGASIIVVTHDPEVGDEAERKIILNHGIIEAEIVRAKRGSASRQGAESARKLTAREAAEQLERERARLQANLRECVAETEKQSHEALEAIGSKLRKGSLLIPADMTRVQGILEESFEDLSRLAQSTSEALTKTKNTVAGDLDRMKQNADFLKEEAFAQEKDLK